jgi:antitoxin VapB
MSHVAKLFTNGRSQAVRLPAAYRFEGKQVYIRRDEKTGDVILSAKPPNWDGFFEAMKGVEVPDDFLSPEERNQGDHRPDPFEGWVE